MEGQGEYNSGQEKGPADYKPQVFESENFSEYRYAESVLEIKDQFTKWTESQQNVFLEMCKKRMMETSVEKWNVKINLLSKAVNNLTNAWENANLTEDWTWSLIQDFQKKVGETESKIEGYRSSIENMNFDDVKTMEDFINDAIAKATEISITIEKVQKEFNEMILVIILPKK